MKSNSKIIIIAAVAVAIGLGIGYLIFGKNQTAMPAESSQQGAQAVQTSGEAEEWICSMHPQIRQPEPGLCPICEMDLIPAGSNESDDPLVLQMTESAAKLANIQTTVIGEGASSGGKTIRLSGKVQEDERLASSQVAHIPGRIEKLYVTFTNEKVKKGQKLADIYSPDLITAQQELLEALKLQEVNPNLVEAARNKLRFWKIGKDVIDAIEQNETIKETFTLFADESGIVAKRKVSVGDYVRQGEPLFDLMNLNKVWVLFDAYEEDLANIKMGERIEFTTPAIPNKTFKTRITFIDPIINPKTRVASLRTEVSNTNGLLKPEMLVYGTLQEKAISKTQLTVPKSAVLWTGKRSVVYVKVPDMEVPSFKYKEIEIGESLGDSYQVISGLEAGEEVVTYGSFTIDAAAQLNNQVSMMNKNVNMKKDETGVPNFQPETPDEFKSQLNALANAYIQLKDAFVATDAATASTAAEKVVAQIEKIDMSLLKGDAHIYWMEQLNALQAHSKKITELEEVEEQRKQFGFLSDALINSIEAFGTAGKALYVQHCPMAFDNQGGDWLALEEQIQNPYFGDKMMKCGLVKKELTERTEVMNSTPNKPMQGHNH
jgi:Cu(I)/Ag(I) efflux system membrane fusion protein